MSCLLAAVLPLLSRTATTAHAALSLRGVRVLHFLTSTCPVGGRPEVCVLRLRPAMIVA